MLCCWSGGTGNILLAYMLSDWTGFDPQAVLGSACVSYRDIKRVPTGCNHGPALLTVEDVAVLQRPSVRDAVADDLVDGRAAGLGEVVVVERRRVAVPRCAGLTRVKNIAGTLQP